MTKNEKTKSVEILTHFACSKCKKWWTVGDATKKKINLVLPLVRRNAEF